MHPETGGEDDRDLGPQSSCPNTWLGGSGRVGLADPRIIQITGRGRTRHVIYALQRWGRNLRDARQGQGMTQLEVANRLSVRQSTVCRWEQGTASPSNAHKVAIARAFGVQVSDLFPS